MQRSQLLDLLRIFAITLVFVAHIGQLLGSDWGRFFGIKNFYYVSLGGVGVTLFLILSGVLMGMTDAHRSVPYYQYMKKKFKRIYPLYLISLPLSILGFIFSHLFVGDGWPNLLPNGFFIDLIGSISGFYTWLGLWGGPYNPPSWFIGLIITMYVISPALIKGLKTHALIFLLVMLSISIASRIYVGQEGLPFVSDTLYNDVKAWAYRQFGFMPGRPNDWFVLCRVFEFSLGIYIGIKVPTKVWATINLPGKRIIAYLSDLSFALFLLHYPWMFLIELMIGFGLPTWLSITLFMLCLCTLSHFTMKIEQKLMQAA